MKYEIENYGYFDQLVIEMRYMLLSLILPLCFIVNDYFGHGIDIRTLRAVLMYFAVITILVPFHAYKKYKSKSKNYLFISNNELIIAFGQYVENIQISNILQCIVFNICGNKNFVIYHSDKTSSFLLNGLNDEFVSEISKRLNDAEVKRANIFQTLKYVISQFREHNKKRD